MLNYSLFNYHPKFFFSLIVNNRYRLRHVEFGGPSVHAALGPGNTIYDGDYLVGRPNLPGSDAWSDTKLYSGLITLVVERRFPDAFVPPVDFAGGYFGDISGGDSVGFGWRRSSSPQRMGGRLSARCHPDAETASYAMRPMLLAGGCDLGSTRERNLRLSSIGRSMNMPHSVSARPLLSLL